MKSKTKGVSPGRIELEARYLRRVAEPRGWYIASRLDSNHRWSLLSWPWVLVVIGFWQKA